MNNKSAANSCCGTFVYGDTGWLVFADRQSRCSGKWFLTIEQVTVGGVHFVFFCTDHGLDHTHHDGIEIANPGQFKTLVMVNGPLCNNLLKGVNHAGFNPFALKFGNYSKN